MKKRHIFAEGKKGISTVIATVLIILIVVVAVVVLWTSILPLMKGNVQEVSDLIEASDFSVIEGGYTSYFPEKERAMVQLKSGPANTTVVELQVRFYISGSSIEYRIPPPVRSDSLPGSNEARVYWFNLTGKGVPEKVSVVAVYLRGDVRVVGSIISMVSIPSKKLTLIDSEVADFETKVISAAV